MFSLKNFVSYFIFLTVFVQIKTLEEIPVIADNDIATAEIAIRNTVNKLLATFKIQDVKHKPRLKQYSTIHNFFVSITLTDCNNLKEITRLTRVGNIDNNTQNFITQINEILNEDDKSYESNDTNNVYVTKYIGMFIRKLKYLKESYISKNNTAINTKVLKLLDDGENPMTNFTEVFNVSKANDSNENTLDDNEFWHASGRRIYQGERTTVKKFPFMASVLFFKKFQCAGSIIKSDLVITSASCLQLAWNNRFFRENPAFLSVQVGSDVYEGGGDKIAVIEIYFYPKYDPKTLRNNLALMRLTRKILFKSKYRRVKKIDIDRNPWPLPNNCPQITVIGWGAKDSSNVISDVFKNKLSYAHLEFYPLKDCQEHYSEDFVTDKNFCAGFLSKGGGACNRDAGGPGVIENTLMGVISFGSPICGATDAPTVFTKLGFYTDWIEQIMQQDVPSNYQMTTTLSHNTLFVPNLNVETETTVKFYPLMPSASYVPTPILDVDHLRIAQDEGFKDFLATMFSNDDITEYLDESANTNEDMNGEQVSDTNEKYQKPAIVKPVRSLKSKVTKAKHKLTTIPTTAAIKALDSSDEMTSYKDQAIESVTESKRLVTVLENVSGNNDKNLEEDIMTLIDNLDIDKMLQPEVTEKTHKPTKSIKSKSNKPDKVTKKKEKEYVKVASSASGENNLVISPKQQSVLNFLFLSEEKVDKKPGEDEELTVQADSYKDLTFRDRPNNTNKPDVLSETALYELISLAIDEEAKRLRKKKRYTL